MSENTEAKDEGEELSRIGTFQDSNAQQPEPGRRHHDLRQHHDQQRRERDVEAPRGDIPQGAAQHREHAQQRPGVEGARSRLDDEQRAGKADGHRRPAPPSDVLAEKQGGRGRQAERRHLQDAHQVGERHARERSLEEQGAAHIADAAPAHGPHERVPEPVDGPGPERGDGDDRDGADAADEYGLAGGRASPRRASWRRRRR